MLGRIIVVFCDILLILFGVFLLSKFQLWFTKHRLKIISLFIILGICLYSFGYLTKSSGSLDYISSGLMAIFSTGRMFVFENDISSFETNVANMPLYNILFGLIMTFSMLVTGMLVLSLLGYRVLCKLQLEFLRHNKNKKVFLFTELNENSLNLANDIKSKNKNSIIILCVNDNNASEESTKLEKEASTHRHFIYTVYDTKDIIYICFKFIRNKTLIFSINENVYDNVSFVDQYAGELKKKNKSYANISLYTFINHNICEDIFYREDLSQLDIHVIDQSDLASRQLFDQFTLLSTLGENKVLTVGIIGFTDICETLYRNIVFLGQCEGVKLKLILIEEDIKNKTAAFFNKNPEIGKSAAFEFIDAKPDTEKYYMELKEHLTDINCIMVTVEQIATVTEISRLCLHNNVKVKLCAFVKNYEKNKLLFGTALLKEVQWFGSTKELFTENNIVNETLDQLAKQCHYYYSSAYSDKRKWEEISLFEKQSNRALALHFQSKLYSVGLRYRVGGDTAIYNELIKDSAILERLTRGEHLRWNAFHYANGWRTMTDIQAGGKNKNIILKLHSCLVDWEELDHVSAVYQRDFKDTDARLIQNLGNILSSAGFGIEKNI